MARHCSHCGKRGHYVSTCPGTLNPVTRIGQTVSHGIKHAHLMREMLHKSKKLTSYERQILSSEIRELD